MKTTRLKRGCPGCHGLPSPSALLPNWSIMCTPWNTYLSGQHGKWRRLGRGRAGKEEEAAAAGSERAAGPKPAGSASLSRCRLGRATAPTGPPAPHALHALGPPLRWLGSVPHPALTCRLSLRC